MTAQVAHFSLSTTIGTILNQEYQAGGDAETLRTVARAVRLTLPESDRATFTEGVEMCGLWLDS